MKTVGAFEAKTHLSQLLDEVEQKHDAILIQKRGRNVAYLVSCALHEKQKNRFRSEEVVNGFRRLREGQAELKSGEIREMIEEGRKW